MLTLSADPHSFWALGTFILEPLEEQWFTRAEGKSSIYTPTL